MSISVLSVRNDAYVANVDGVVSTIPRALMNCEMQRLLDYGQRRIAYENGVYNAFPGWALKKGLSIAFIFSSGLGHGNSQRQIGARSDDNGETWRQSIFFENAGSAFDFSCIDGMLETGEVWPAKNVFKVRKTANGYETKIQSTVAVTSAGANNGTYAIWTAAPVRIGLKLLCTGYRTSQTPWVAALFESSDDGWTWEFASVIAAEVDTMFNEAAIVRASNDDLVSIIRVDAGSGRPLYQSRSSDDGATWSSPQLLSGMQGVQPSLTLLPDGDLVLMVGHRTGTSGLGPSGKMRDERNITGIRAWRSSNHGVTWPNSATLAPMWSTDGGQPMPVLLDESGKLGCACYLAPGATNGDSGVEPGIYWLTFQGNNLVG